jgi:hypothetical protein
MPEYKYDYTITEDEFKAHLNSITYVFVPLALIEDFKRKGWGIPENVRVFPPLNLDIN